MKLRAWALSLPLLFLTLATVPAAADDVYDNGPINGNINPWTIDFGFVVSDNFFVPNGSATITGLSFGAWLFPGDTLTSVVVSITSAEFGGTTYFDTFVDFSASNCFVNTFGYDVCKETGSFAGVNLPAGTYWLNLQNASVPDGDPVFWDENSGPSQASENSIGTIPSESFTILGTVQTTTEGTTPEPGSILLFCSGVAVLAPRLRCKLS
jgi:hypothetical protein